MAGDETSERPGTRESLVRDMGLFDITMIGVGAMIGAGIFVLTGEAAGVAGPSLVLAFALNGMVSILTAMVYAELGSAIPEAGGGYLWIKEGLPGGNAFLAGWMSWFAHAVAGALYALGFGAFVFELLRSAGVPLASWGLGLGVSQKILGVAVVAVFAAINFRGSSETGMAGNLVTVGQLLTLGVFCAFGLKHMFLPALGPAFGAGGGMGFDQLQPFLPPEAGWTGMISAMGITFIAFEGYEIIVQAGEEVEDPRRNIPKAIFWSLAIVVPIYMLVAVVLIGASSGPGLVEAIRSLGGAVPEGVSEDVPTWKLLRHVGELGLATTAAQFVPFGKLLILLGGVFSTMSALNATTFSSTRVAFAMGRDRNLPDAFASVHEARHTPYVALGWTAVLMAVMVIFVPLTTVAAAADIMFLLLFLQVNVAVLTLRRRYGDRLAYGYLIPFFPVVPILGIVTKLFLALFLFHHYSRAWAYALAWLALGVVLWRVYARERERAEEAPPVVLEEAPVEARPRSVLVPVADLDRSDELLRIGARLASVQDGELVLLHVVTVPRELPLRAGHRLARDARERLADAHARAEDHGVPVRSLLRIAHRPASAIVYTAADTRCEFVLMGWRGAFWRTGSEVGRNVDRVAMEANCHLVVVQADGDRYHRILVPVSHPEKAALPLGIAAVLGGGAEGVQVDVLHLTEEPLDEEDRAAFREAVEEAARSGAVGEDEDEDEDEDEGDAAETLFGEGSRHRLLFDTHDGPVHLALAEASADYDRMILGMTLGQRLWGREVLEDDARRVARAARCPVVFVHPRVSGTRFEVQSFFQFFRDLEAEAREREEEADDDGRGHDATEGERG